MWKLLSGAILTSSIAVAAVGGPIRANHLVRSEYRRCVELGFRVGTPHFRECVNRRSGAQHRRVFMPQPPSNVVVLSRPAAATDDATPDDPARLTNSELQKADAGPPAD